MALFASQLVTSASGSVGGLTFLRTAGGMALRGRAIPPNRNSPLQHRIRAALAYLTNYWIQTLLPKDREEWADYAQNVPSRNRLGHIRTISPLSTWIAAQLPRLNANLLFSRFAPRLFTKATFAPITPVAAQISDSELSFNFDPKDDWAKEIASAMLVYASRPQNASHHAHNKSYRLVGTIKGNPLVPPTTPAKIILPYPLHRRQRVLFRVAVTRADGRYSDTQRATVLAS